MSCRCNITKLYDQIVADVVSVTGVHRANIHGKLRTPSCVKARQAVWWLMRSLSDASYPEIAKMAKRDHTTIMFGVDRASRPEVMAIIDAVVETNPELYGSAKPTTTEAA